ncbi:Glycosyl transferase family 8 [Nesidiocoris tenuis]|uniref:UDP-D-xylose:beta-D-glucoside alpha-1,3-D-xylosyltransferase n=1 Tax=Nesidiocoris tenuis TaxID=355587 RepID=A0ABN7AER7_9HEMI|nr:Glycosyl transferase family 8 [Nesidiocoris tenuis]
MKLVVRFVGFVFIVCLILFLALNEQYLKRLMVVHPDVFDGGGKPISGLFATPDPEKSALTSSVKRNKQDVVLSVVVCGDRVQETLVMIKSAVIFSQDSTLRIVVVAEPTIIPDFEEKLTEWKNLLNGSFEFETHRIRFPDKGGDEWIKLFKPCASQRLFLPSVLTNTDAILYVDTDVLFLSPPENVWKYFNQMNSTQLAALAPEHEDPNTGWYNRFARHPFYGELGLNSGVMLMNLTRMREFKWEKYLVPIFKEYKLKMTWGDQDIINIIFHFHPERLLVYDCSYNYRSDHCMYRSVCKPAESHGVNVLHGSRGTFHNEKQPAFKAIFQAFEEYQIGSDVYQYLLLPMESYLKNTVTTNCGKLHDMFLKQIQEFVGDRDYFS